MLPRHLAAMLAGVALMVACDSSRVVGPRDLERFNQAQALWKSRSFPDYSYEIRVICFCAPEVTQWARVSVRGGSVVSVEALEENPQYPIINFQYWVPIDTIFSDLYRTMTDTDAQWYLDEIVVSYDAQLGFPTNIEYRAKANVADGGSVHTLRNVRPLN